MSILIIDGYNLLGKTNNKERDQLIQDLVVYKKKKNNDIIVFFDGTHGGTRFGDEMIVENIKVIFTPLHETADDQMIAYMEENTHKDIIVVSSDRKIQKAATAHLFSYFDSKDFLARMRSKSTASQEEVDDSPYLPKKSTKKKGNPRKKSKKERKKQQQLKKL